MEARFPAHFVFLCGAHMDQVMRLKNTAVKGSSNPAEIELTPGGAALNSASISVLCGLRSTLVSPVGNDTHGENLRATCVERDIGDHLVSMAGSTGIYAGIFQPTGDIFIGVADLAIYDQIDENWIRAQTESYRGGNSGLFLTTNLAPDLMAVACEGFEAIAAATISPAKAGRLKPLLDKIDLLFTNQREAVELTGTQANSGRLAKELFECGVKSGVISDGGNPLVFWDGRDITQHLPPLPSNIADVNGAGDALAGACLSALSRGYSMHDAVAYGAQIAAKTLEYPGPYPGDHAFQIPKVYEADGKNDR